MDEKVAKHTVDRALRPDIEVFVHLQLVFHISQIGHQLIKAHSVHNMDAVFSKVILLLDSKTLPVLISERQHRSRSMFERWVVLLKSNIPD